MMRSPFTADRRFLTAKASVAAADMSAVGIVAVLAAALAEASKAPVASFSCACVHAEQLSDALAPFPW
jgi:hypothetical protein